MRNISVTRALCELKLYDSKIQKALNDIRVIDFTQKKYEGKALQTNKPIQEFLDDAKSKYESLTKLISNRNEIKNKITQSNAVTMVKVGDKEISVAEAIESRRSISYSQAILESLKRQRVTMNNKLETDRMRLDKEVNNLINQNLTSGSKKINDKDYEIIAKPFIESNEVKAVVAIDLDKEIDRLESHVEAFDSNLDIVLSESNSKTMIEVSD